MPRFFQLLIDFVEELRDNHPNVENYNIKKLFYLIKINDKIKTRSYVDNYQLYLSMNNVINASEKDSTKARKMHEELIKGYQNGRRNS